VQRYLNDKHIVQCYRSNIKNTTNVCDVRIHQKTFGLKKRFTYQHISQDEI